MITEFLMESLSGDSMRSIFQASKPYTVVILRDGPTGRWTALTG
jgi:hypothetical protein